MSRAKDIEKFKKIVSRIQKGDENALNGIFEEYRDPFVYQFLKMFGEDINTATSIYIDALLAFKKNIAENKTPNFTAKFETYLFKIGKNIYLNSKRGKKISLIEYSDRIEEEVQQTIFEEEETQKVIITTEEIIKLENAIILKLDQLKSKCQEILKQTYYNGIKAEELANLMELESKNALYTQRSRCLDILRELVFSDLSESEINKQILEK
ncbi:MAG: sigma-70 family RNA polymerase sigma factor [Bacteroidetes bacterium]|jgi:RNA polymerase sigma factor (sigma-70 family)|nr:sigma-70 family RNA polymerase sigma factor [Bacteroidota bacterium]MBT6685639.1 sigma-70 family RNA polymerase sigma factor [Bacteroidota bacterium]MBT7141863.1 sigma-70 family RNA polymerase sigma factor [Bacteroidota bacterium]MBT7491060.1 sigma-70 family RNA polymerase sigma factor [Bacteroidota bacterium]